MQLSDLASSAFYEDPYPFYRELRAAGALIPFGERTWITGQHRIVDTLLKDRRIGKSFMETVRARYGDEKARYTVFRLYEQMMLFANPPEHTRLRALLMQAFTGKQIAQFQVQSQAIANRLVDQFEKEGRADLVRQYARRLPLEIICAVIDVPLADTEMLIDAVTEFIREMESVGMTAAQIDTSNAAAEQLVEYFTGVLRERRQTPGEDIISLMILAEENGLRLTDEEIVSNIILVFIAGHETSINMIGNSLISLHRHPDALKRVLADPALIPGLVSECLRFDTSVQMTRRTPTEDMVIEGVSVTKGETIFFSYGSANRDPERYPEPDSFIVDRPDAEVRALTFGTGIHYCLGARLAIVQIEIALGTLMRRLPALKITNLDSLRWHQRNNLRGVETLEAVW